MDQLVEHLTWFRLRSLSQGHGIKPHMGLHDEGGDCLSFSLYLSPCPSLLLLLSLSFSIIFLMFIYFWDREREWGTRRERGRHRIWSRFQALNCQHRAQRGARTHELWDHDLSWSQSPKQLSHPCAPNSIFFKCNKLLTNMLMVTKEKPFYTYLFPNKIPNQKSWRWIRKTI